MYRVSPITRREILRQAAVQASAVWALLGQTHSHPDAPAASGALKFFSPEQAKEVEAMAAQIIPADDTPGAREAGVIRFIDLNLVEYQVERQPDYIAGLKVLAEKAGGRFADLDSARQIEVLRAIEKTEFFGLVRQHTIMGSSPTRSTAATSTRSDGSSSASRTHSYFSRHSDTTTAPKARGYD